MELDIRTETKESVTSIVFAEKQPLWLTLTTLKPMFKNEGISLQCPGRCDAMCLHSREDVDNLIKALEKAKELGWV